MEEDEKIILSKAPRDTSTLFITKFSKAATEADMKRECLKKIGSDPNSPYGLFNYIEMWEHEFMELLAKDSDLKEIYEKVQLMDMEDPLSLRKAFMGGRTEVFKHKIDTDGISQWLNYYDFAR